MKFILLMVAVSMVTFVLVSVSPIDPVQANVGQAAYVNMSEAKRAQLAEYWGVNTPLWERYASWLGDLLHGDLGTSLRFNAPVADVIATRAVNSLALMATAWVVSGVLGFGLGILAGANRGRPIDRIVKGYCFLLASVPTFWLGLVFLIVFSVWLGGSRSGSRSHRGVGRRRDACSTRCTTWRCPRSRSRWWAWRTSRCTRARRPSTCWRATTCGSPARAGCPPGAPCATTGCATWCCPRSPPVRAIAEIFGGSVLVEQVFCYPGLGQAAVTAGLGGDVALLAGIALVSAAFVFGGNLVANVLYGVVDPACAGGEGSCVAERKPASADTADVLHLPRARRLSTAAGPRYASRAAVGNRKLTLAALCGGARWPSWWRASCMAPEATATDFAQKNLAPSPAHPFGTDWMGRDMLRARWRACPSACLVGLGAAGASLAHRARAGAVAALGGKKADAAVTWLIDLMMGIPHIVLLILISFALGKGFWGVTIGVAVTHWPSLARVVRAEILQCRQSSFVAVARNLGAGPCASP